VGTLIEFSPADAVFWAFALTTGFARFADARWLRGQTSMGKPATMKDIVRYEAILAGIVIVMWILAHVIANARS